jgi:hypothetical protein
MEWGSQGGEYGCDVVYSVRYVLMFEGTWYLDPQLYRYDPYNIYYSASSRDFDD